MKSKKTKQQPAQEDPLLCPHIAGVTLKVLVIEGKDLVAKDRSIIGIRTTSDPYVDIYWGYAPKDKDRIHVGKTQTIPKNCKNPKWKSFHEISVGADMAERLLRKRDCLELRIWDQDELTRDDFMGVVKIDVVEAAQLGPLYKAYPVMKGVEGSKLYCRNAKGFLEVQITVEARKLITVERGSMHLLADSKILAGVAWTVENNRHIDIDASCVAVDNMGRVRMEDTVYYNRFTNQNGSLTHSGDDRTGESQDDDKDDDEVIFMDLEAMPQETVALYFILTISERTWADVKSARIRFIAKDTTFGICQMLTSDLVGKNNPNTALFLLRISRGTDDPKKWFLIPIGDGEQRARDFGTLIPQIRNYTRDLVPNMGYINPLERVALLKKSGTIRLSEYLGQPFPDLLVMGLAWQSTDVQVYKGAHIDLDASAILMGKDYSLIDIVWFGHSVSDNNGSVVHTGDQKTGETVGDDEQITVKLLTVPENVNYICFSINSFSGEPLKDVSTASCHFFDPLKPPGDGDIARHEMTGAKEIQDKTGLLMVCLFRGSGDKDDWYLHIASQPVYGRKAQENLADWQAVCKRLKPPPPLEHPEVLREMPQSYPSPNETHLIPAKDLPAIFPKV